MLPSGDGGGSTSRPNSTGSERCNLRNLLDLHRFCGGESADDPPILLSTTLITAGRRSLRCPNCIQSAVTPTETVSGFSN